MNASNPIPIKSKIFCKRLCYKKAQSKLIPQSNGKRIFVQISGGKTLICQVKKSHMRFLGNYIRYAPPLFRRRINTSGIVSYSVKEAVVSTQSTGRGIADVIAQKSHVTFFDLAYQGFASGDLDKDAFAVRLWNQLGLSFFVAQSFAKNFGLYGDRVGCVHLVLPPGVDVDVESVYGQFSRIIRAQYSNPPAHGSNLVKTILQNPVLLEQWKVDLKVMSSRLHDVRQKLYGKLIELKTPGEWHHIVDQIGMFTYTGLTSSQVDSMIEKHHVYMLRSGRISLAGLNDTNIQHVAEAIHSVVIESAKL
eukprot:TRINITY_DN1311_c0_g1_i27.p1 TRINITY_DN1311_c0_g1~~TRINITY_DN1311_c0_g1_i27.p1  ORF type:complete len:306 (-),score=45.78 TRINITY_DN1311_c0_g1_i27:147-1064(-)